MNFIISLFVSSLYINKAFGSSLKFNDFFNHDSGTYLSLSVHPWEAISSLKGLAFPGFDYGSVLGAYLLFPFTFFKVDLFTIHLFANYSIRFLSYLIIAIYFFYKKRLIFAYCSLIYPLLINDETNFTWGYYPYSETEFISVLLMLYLIQNKKYHLLAFFLLGVILRLDLRQLPLFVIALIFFSHLEISDYRTFIEKAIKNFVSSTLGFILTFFYLIFINPISHSNFNFNIEFFSIGLVRLKKFLGISSLTNTIFFIFILLYFLLILISVKQLSNNLDKFRLFTSHLLVVLIVFIFLCSNRMIEIYTTFNPNRIFLTLPLVFFVLLSFNRPNFVLVPKGKFVPLFTIITTICVSFWFGLKPINVPSLETQGPVPILERLSLKKDCENLVKFGPNIGTEYIETIDWRLGFTCDALLIPDKRYKFINANSMGLGEVRPWRREVINR
jgi:hypothetical protein